MTKQVTAFLKAKRIGLGLSQANISKQLGISRETLNRIEAGKYGMTLDKYLKLCEVLKADPCEGLKT